ncbi:MAG: sigma-70 family RNA polymerase sigma factor [Lachnospiraceae bacterium]|nr:sigma-70 family RNA polymerase sigma factor [Lachnospiraceae bacterium]MCM1231990.1 sigma-70 family RNA polymerase sigma factor [Ruminococcus flavefaciens]
MGDQEFYIRIEEKLVPVTEEVYYEYYRGIRRERYMMEDLKKGRTVVSPDTGGTVFIPGREESLERLQEKGTVFAAPGESMEERVVRSVLLAQALEGLSSEEQDLVRELYYLGKTEREAAGALHMTKTTLRYKHEQLILKLRNLLR